MVKDPDTGRRVSRAEPGKQWQVSDVPHLAIVSRELFEAAGNRKKAQAHVLPTYQRRPRHLLSGLLRCGCCGAGMSTNGKDKSGQIRFVARLRQKAGPVRILRPFISLRSKMPSSPGYEIRTPAPGGDSRIREEAIRRSESGLPQASVATRSRIERRLGRSSTGKSIGWSMRSPRGWAIRPFSVRSRQR